MEALAFHFTGGRAVLHGQPRIVGAVASGNLEVLIEPVPGNGCAIEVSTAAIGFGAIWAAVLADFFQRHPLAGVRISINDAGATPAVVSLRLDQAATRFARRTDA